MALGGNSIKISLSLFCALFSLGFLKVMYIFVMSFNIGRPSVQWATPRLVCESQILLMEQLYVLLRLLSLLFPIKPADLFYLYLLKAEQNWMI